MEAINNLMSFRAISNFVRDLNQVFGESEKYRQIALYNRLLEKTTVSHEKPVAKHIECFNQFCVANREAILEKSLEKIISPLVSYSDKVFIDTRSILIDGDDDTKEAIWNHLLAISAIVDPGSNAKKILKENMERQLTSVGGAGGNEEEFLSNIINKVETSLDPSTMENPLQAVGSILSSGILTDVVGNMQKGLSDGSLNLGKLMGSMQNVMGKMNGGQGIPGLDLGSVAGMLGGMAGNGGNIDPSALTSMIGGLGGAGGNGGLDLGAIAGLLGGMSGNGANGGLDLGAIAGMLGGAGGANGLDMSAISGMVGSLMKQLPPPKK